MYWFVAGGTVAGAALGVMMTLMSHTSARLSVWLDPFTAYNDGNWSTRSSSSSLHAVASGEACWGQSRQKYLYLPRSKNDFIFAVVCEELGFIGASMVILLFVLLILRGYWIALHARDRFGSLVVVGITTLLAAQVFLNIAVITNLIPTTGISLPLFSYGGTALMIQLAEVGDHTERSPGRFPRPSRAEGNGV